MLKTQTQTKPRLNKHIIANKTHIRNMHKTTKSERPKLEILPQHNNSLELDFDH